ncbi:hypothetical protein AYK25_07490 [Thermoplasmatales archaeon SM1-50]|jgi:hypothetical protein|nr:MAG: hypothetical protein AYK25_07490 [Thermoplasmatales archaeon SM1-50]
MAYEHKRKGGEQIKSQDKKKEIQHISNNPVGYGGILSTIEVLDTTKRLTGYNIWINQHFNTWLEEEEK